MKNYIKDYRLQLSNDLTKHILKIYLQKDWNRSFHILFFNTHNHVICASLLGHHVGRLTCYSNVHLYNAFCFSLSPSYSITSFSPSVWHSVGIWGRMSLLQQPWLYLSSMWPVLVLAEVWLLEGTPIFLRYFLICGSQNPQIWCYSRKKIQSCGVGKFVNIKYNKNYYYMSL